MLSFLLATLAATPLAAQDALSDWSGFYVGAGVLTGIAEYDVAVLEATDPQGSDLGRFDLDQAHIFAGYMWDFGPYAVGVEGQVFGSDPAGVSNTVDALFAACDFGGAGDCAFATANTQIDPTFRLRAIGGYEVTERALAFGALGLVRADVTYAGVGAVSLDAGVGGSLDQTAVLRQNATIDGISLGLGIEHRVTDAFSLRMSVNHDIFNSFRINNGTSAGAGGPGPAASIEVTDFIDFTTTSLELGMVLRF